MKRILLFTKAFVVAGFTGAALCIIAAFLSGALQEACATGAYLLIVLCAVLGVVRGISSRYD